MRHPQILLYEPDGRLADVLRDAVQTHGWRLRPVRHLRVCLGLLPQGGASVFVLKVGRDLLPEMTLLERTTALFPETATVAVCDPDQPAVAGLAWDLGARFVLAAAEAAEQLPAVVAGLLAAEGP